MDVCLRSTRVFTHGSFPIGFVSNWAQLNCIPS